MAQVFKVHDDEWEDLVGVEQLEEHAKIQMQAFLDELGWNVEDRETKDDEQILKEEVEYRLDDKEETLKEVKALIEKYDNNETFTVEESKLALSLRYFDVDDLDIH